MFRGHREEAFLADALQADLLRLRLRLPHAERRSPGRRRRPLPRLGRVPTSGAFPLATVTKGTEDAVDLSFRTRSGRGGSQLRCKPVAAAGGGAAAGAGPGHLAVRSAASGRLTAQLGRAGGRGRGLDRRMCWDRAAGVKLTLTYAKDIVY